MDRESITSVSSNARKNNFGRSGVIGSTNLHQLQRGARIDSDGQLAGGRIFLQKHYATIEEQPDKFLPTRDDLRHGSAQNLLKFFVDEPLEAGAQRVHIVVEEISRALRHLGSAGDFSERQLREAGGAEHLPGGIEQELAPCDPGPTHAHDAVRLRSDARSPSSSFDLLKLRNHKASASPIVSIPQVTIVAEALDFGRSLINAARDERVGRQL